jgi:hypothetical protein
MKGGKMFNNQYSTFNGQVGESYNQLELRKYSGVVRRLMPLFTSRLLVL